MPESIICPTTRAEHYFRHHLDWVASTAPLSVLEGIFGTISRRVGGAHGIYANSIANNNE